MGVEGSSQLPHPGQVPPDFDLKTGRPPCGAMVKSSSVEQRARTRQEGKSLEAYLGSFPRLADPGAGSEPLSRRNRRFWQSAIAGLGKATTRRRCVSSGDEAHHISLLFMIPV